MASEGGLPVSDESRAARRALLLGAAAVIALPGRAEIEPAQPVIETLSVGDSRLPVRGHRRLERISCAVSGSILTASRARL